jgi:hypothetical protein
MRILWHGTPLSHRAATVGMNMGLAVLVWEDIRSGDPRYTSLSVADKREVVAWAVAATDELRNEKLRCLDFLLRGIDPVLKRAT